MAAFLAALSIAISGGGRADERLTTQRLVCPELVLQYSSTRRPDDIAFAAQAPVLATSGDQAIDIWNTHDWTLLRTIDTGPSRGYRNFNTKALAVSPDGVRVALLDGDGPRIWATSSGSLLRKISGKLGFPVGIVWSPDGRRLAAGGTDGVSIWDGQTGKLVRSLPASGDVAFSKDGRMLATAGESSAFLFDVGTGKKLRSFHDKSGVEWPVAISPDGRYVATGGEDPTWESPSVRYDKDGDRIGGTEADYSHELKIKLWDRGTGRRVRMFPGHNNLDGGSKALQFTRDGRRLFVGGGFHSSLYDVRSGKRLRDWENEDASALSPDARTVALTHAGTVSVFSTANGKKLRTLPSPPRPVISLAFSPDGKILATGDGDIDATGLRLWSMQDGRLVRSLQGPPPDLREVAFLPDGRLLSNSLNGIFIWDVDTWKLQKKTAGPESTWALLTPDGSKVVDDGGHGLIVRDSATGKTLAAIPAASAGFLSDAAFSPDGRYIVVQMSGPTPQTTVWDLRTGVQVSQLADTGSGALTLRFSLDSSTIAGIVEVLLRKPGREKTAEGAVMLWDAGSGAVKKQLVLGEECPRTLAFSSDGRTLAAAAGPSVRFYDTESLHLTRTLQAGKSSVESLAFSPDGSRLAAGGDDGFIRVWDVSNARLLITMLGLPSQDPKKTPSDWIAFTPDGFYDWSPGAVSLIRWRYKGALYPAAEFAARYRRQNLLRLRSR